MAGQSQAELEAMRPRETETEVVPEDSVRSGNPGRDGVSAGTETSEGERVKEVVCLEG